MEVKKALKNEQKTAFFEEFCFENEDFEKVGLKPFSVCKRFRTHQQSMRNHLVLVLKQCFQKNYFG